MTRFNELDDVPTKVDGKILKVQDDVLTIPPGSISPESIARSVSSGVRILGSIGQAANTFLTCLISGFPNEIRDGNNPNSLMTTHAIREFVRKNRDKYVAFTSHDSHGLAQQKSTTGTGQVTYTLSEFNSSDSDFSSSRIKGIVIQGEATYGDSGSGGGNENRLQVQLPDGSTYTTVVSIEKTSADGGTLLTKGSLVVPINENQSSFVIQFIVGDADNGGKIISRVRGAIIGPMLA